MDSGLAVGGGGLIIRCYHICRPLNCTLAPLAYMPGFPDQTYVQRDLGSYRWGVDESNLRLKMLNYLLSKARVRYTYIYKKGASYLAWPVVI